MSGVSLNRRILLIVLAFTVASQAIYLYVTVRSFRNSYHQVVQTNLTSVGTTLQGNLDYILSMGISINKLVGLKSLLNGILSDAPNLNYIAIHDLSGNWLYYCDRQGFLKGDDFSRQMRQMRLEGSLGEFRLPFELTGPGEEAEGGLVLGIDQELVAKKVKEIALDSATVVLISILAIVDFLLFFVAYTVSLPVKSAAEQIRLVEKEGLLGVPIRRTGIDFLDPVLDRFDQYRNRFKEEWIRLTAISQSLTRAHDWQGVKEASAHEALSRLRSTLSRFRLVGEDRPQIAVVESPVLIRPAVFLFVFAEALSISFLPLYAKELYRPLWNLSEEVVLGLPISAFMLFTAISLPLAGAWSDMVGRKRSFLTGMVISAVGLFLSGTAGDIVSLIVYRSIAGLGFGIVYMTAQGYILDATTASNRAEGMAIFLSAFYGGTLCGSAIGGMVADRVGFRVLFYLGAVLAISSVVFLYLFIAEKPRTNRVNTKGHESRKWSKVLLSTLPSPRNLVKLFSDRDFAALTLLQSIPNKICLIGFVYYLAPLLLRNLGNSQSDTGRYVMGYSLVMILLSQIVSRWSDRHHKMRSFISWGGVFSGLALVPFFFVANTFMVALSIILLGLAHTLSVSNQVKLASQLKTVRQIGLGPGLGVYRQVERVGNILAPIILGVLASVVGYARSLALIGTYTVLSSLIYILISSRRSYVRVVLSDDEPVFLKVGARETRLIDLGAGGLSFQNIDFRVGESHRVSFHLASQNVTISVVLKIVRIDKQNICRCRFEEIEEEAVETIHEYLLMK